MRRGGEERIFTCKNDDYMEENTHLEVWKDYTKEKSKV
jgi:hypothetical protein